MACQLILPDGCDSPPWQRERAGPPAARAPDFAIKTGTSINPSDTQNIHYGATRTAHPDASIAAHNGGSRTSSSWWSCYAALLAAMGGSPA